MARVALLAALLIAGCATPPARPDFMARSLRDCAGGDQGACAMLDSLAAPGPEARPEARPRTQSERDADAIVSGMRRAKSPSPVPNMRIAPSTERDS
jgi:hypothetical protein